MIHFLRDHFETIDVVYTGSETVFVDEQVTLHPFDMAIFLRCKFRKFLESISKHVFGIRKDHFLLLWLHVAAFFSIKFYKFARQTVKNADVIFVEYSFFCRTVSVYAKTFRIPIYVTQHDVLHSIDSPGLYRRLLQIIEVFHLKSADKMFCVSSGDAEVFRSLGLEPIVSPHPVKADASPQPLRVINNDTATLTSDFYPEGNFCLFVGGRHSPNVTAAESLRRLSQTFSRSAVLRNYTIVLAGACASPESKVNFISLGQVSNQTLDDLYGRCFCVLIPIESGTGVSVKAVEAFVKGCAIISTSTGVRGIDAKNRVNCLINDDPSTFAADIESLVFDHELRTHIQNNASLLGREHAPEFVFKDYII